MQTRINSNKNNMKTFREFCYHASELLESSASQSEGRRVLSSRGPQSGNRGKKQRKVTSLRASLQRAGFRGLHRASGYGATSHNVSHSPEHTTKVTSYKNPIQYVTTSSNPNFRMDIQGGEELESHREKSRMRKLALKGFIKQLRSRKTNKPVHEVSIDEKGHQSSKNEPYRAFPRAKSFAKETQNISKSLSSSGATPGSYKVGEPTGMMRGEDEKEGAQRRGRLYRKIGTFGPKARLKPTTGLMVGRVRP